MGGKMNPLKQLGQSVAEAQDELLDQGDTLSRARTRFLNMPTPRPRRGRLLLTGGLAGAAAVGVLLFILIKPSKAPEFFIGNEDNRGEVGHWITARSGETVPLRFSDGSVLHLQPRSGARVRALNKRGATLLLERGAAEVYVVPRRNNRWSVDAGPFEVLVKGTHFDVAWDPAAEIFALNLRKGRVTVRGPVLKERHFVAGEAVRVWVNQGRMEIKTKARRSAEPLVARESRGARGGAVERRSGVENRALTTHSAASARRSAARPSVEDSPLRETHRVPRASSTLAPTAGAAADPAGRLAGAPVRRRSDSPGAGSMGAERTPSGDLADEPHPLANRGSMAGQDSRPANPAVANRSPSQPPEDSAAKRPSAQAEEEAPGKPRATKSSSKPATKAANEAATKAATKAAGKPPVKPLPPDQKKDQRSPYALAKEGRYQEAMEVARASWPKILAQAPQDKLLLIGDAVRLAGDGRLAQSALQSVRQRFPNSAEAKIAAFYLGRINLDQLKDYRAAARWFQLYLQESPAGGLTHEALGRLMESRHWARDLAGARQTARLYLSRYETGPYAEIARALLGQGKAKPTPPTKRSP